MYRLKGLLIIFTLFLIACPAKKNITPTKEMIAFMGSFDGSHFTIMNSLEKFKENANVSTDDIEIKDLKNPIIMDQKADNGYDIYILKASDMEKSYIYDVYWKKGKIVKVIEDIILEKS